MCLRHRRKILSMAALDDLLPLGTGLERSYPVYVRGRLKFRVKQMVYVAFSLDETVMGFAFPKEERTALVASEPHKFHMPSPSDLRFKLGPRRPCRTGAGRGPRAGRRRLAHGRAQEGLPYLRCRAPQRTGLNHYLRAASGRSIGAQNSCLSAPIRGQPRCGIPAPRVVTTSCTTWPHGVGRHAAMSTGASSRRQRG